MRGGVLLRVRASAAAAEKTKIVRHKTSGEIDLFSPVNTKEKVNNLGILAVEKLDNQGNHIVDNSCDARIRFIS